jgi:hypothetical protein
MDEQGLSKLIDKAARNNNIPEIRHANRPHSPGFIDVYLCGVEVECFDTYYYTAAQKAGDLVSSLNVRIRDCASDIIKEKDDANVLLKVELVELRKANAELEKELKVTPKLQGVLDFLLGIGDIEGYDFSEGPEDQGPYWWRAHLREALKAGN